jgi:hypothetical protein
MPLADTLPDSLDGFRGQGVPQNKRAALMWTAPVFDDVLGHALTRRTGHAHTRSVLMKRCSTPQRCM